jgi:hypothetical protein
MKWLEKSRDIIRAGRPKEGNRSAGVRSKGESLPSKVQRLKLAEVFTNEIFEELLSVYARSGQLSDIFSLKIRDAVMICVSCFQNCYIEERWQLSSVFTVQET